MRLDCRSQGRLGQGTAIYAYKHVHSAKKSELAPSEGQAYKRKETAALPTKSVVPLGGAFRTDPIQPSSRAAKSSATARSAEAAANRSGTRARADAEKLQCRKQS